MKYKAVIFDLDGTLLDTLQDLADSMNHVLESEGLPIHETEKYRYFVGNGAYNLVKRSLPPDKQEESYIRYCQTLFKKEYGKRWADTTKPYEGIPELLDKLTDLGFKLAVLSNKPHEATLLVVNKLLPNWTFDAVFGEREGVPRKPDPAGALEISQLFGIPTNEFIYFGDTSTDMVTAKAAKMFAVGVLWGFRTADELMDNGADLIIEKPLDIFKFIQTE